MFHYLDNAATTQTRPEAAQAAVTAMTEEWGNPSSRYAFGQEASGRLKEHRAQVAAGLGCRPEEVYFLSCGTEGDNWAIAAAVEKNRRKGKHIITTAIEHAAVEAGRASLERDLAHMRELKDYAARTLREQVPGLELIGAGTAPHILPVTLPGYKSEVVLRFLSDRGIYVSSGSACHKGKPSHVYAALKLPKPQLDGILRISFSYDTAREDVDALVQGLKEAQAQLFTSLS